MKVEDLNSEIELTNDEAKANRGGWGYLLAARWGGWSRTKLPGLVFRQDDMDEEEPEVWRV